VAPSGGVIKNQIEKKIGKTLGSKNTPELSWRANKCTFINANKSM
jgi:hypothetical protein